MTSTFFKLCRDLKLLKNGTAAKATHLQAGTANCVTDLHSNTHHLLVYVNPTKGRWSPEKAVWEGGGMVS